MVRIILRRPITLLLALAALVILTVGVTSRWHRFRWTLRDGPGTWSYLHLEHGQVSVMTLHYLANRPHLRTTLAPGTALSEAGLRRGIPVHGFARSEKAGPLSGTKFLAFPLWAPLGIAAAYPSGWGAFWLIRRARRRARGLCVGCGYDLTANESGVCPECGGRVRRAPA